MNCGCDVSYVGPTLANTCYGGAYILFMSLLEVLIRNKCDISEVCQRVVPRKIPDIDYHFVVIGGGSAGAAVAGRLAENKDWWVLLLEAGGDEPAGAQVPSFFTNYQGDPYMDWNYYTAPQEMACLGNPEQKCAWPRGKVLGGTGVVHGMMYMRGPPKDYDSWEAMGNTGWGSNDLLDYFKKSEGNQQIGTLVNADLHGADGPMSVSRFPHHPELAEDILEAAKEFGYPVVNDLNVSPYHGFTIAQANVLNGTRMSSARAFLRPLRDHLNLHVMVNSTATKVILDTKSGTKKISKVEFIYNNMTYQVNVLNEAIIAAGAINSPQILLLSGIGPKDELDKVGIEQVHDLPGVGKNLHNHVAFFTTYNLKSENYTNTLDWVQTLHLLTSRQGPLTSSGMAQLTARLNSKYADPAGDYPDLQFFFGGNLPNCTRTGRIGEPAIPEDPGAYRFFTISPVVLQPKSRGYIGLQSSNPLDPPIMDPKYLTDPIDVATLIDGIRISRSFANSTILKEKYDIEIAEATYGDCGDKYTFDSDEYWECAARYSTGPENHQTGTCKMGPGSDPMAVVDPELRVHGIEGLRVMDASVMPQVVAGNPHATIVLIAEKGVEFLRQKWPPK